MKIKILFMVINMNIGGTEKALLNLVTQLPREQFDITILLLEKRGGFIDAIPGNVQIDCLDQYKEIKREIQDPPFEVAWKFFKRGRIIKALHFGSIYLASKLATDRRIFYKYILKDIPIYKNEYDLAVAYAGPMDFISYFIANKVKARKKVQWIHFDIQHIGFDLSFTSKIYTKFDKVFTVSNEGRRKLVKKLPIIDKKTDVFPNLISPTLIKKTASSGSGFTDDFSGTRILTVGRLSSEKGQDIAIEALIKLIEDGFHVKWYCVGGGNAKKTYEQMVRQLGLEDHFIFLGEDLNPYQYMKQCDIYVQPSRHEGYCITLAEAKLFHKPIVTTDFTGAREQIIHKETGLIVDMNKNEVYAAVKKILNDSILYQKLRSNLSLESQSSTDEIEKLYNLVK